MSTTTKQKVIGGCFALTYALFVAGPQRFEPPGLARCETVEIVGLVAEYRSTRFVVEKAAQNGMTRRWGPGAYGGAFPTEYRGPAVLLLKRSGWTGQEYPTISDECPDDGAEADPASNSLSGDYR